MNENFTSNNIENEDLNLNIQDIDYKNLIIRLKEIKKNIVLLEKTLFK